MYLAIIILPLLGSIVSGFFGRKIGVSGAQVMTCAAVVLTTLLAVVAFFEVGYNNIPVSIEVFRWIDSESLNVWWGFHFDSLTVSMLIPVLIVSSLVHIYSIGYMANDPHNQRFFSYLSLFTFMMVILVTANNYLLMFVGWEGVGVCSYLLVCFWFTRIAANQSALSAFLTNRVGDCFLTIGMFGIIWSFGNLDYATVFSLAPYMNENVVTLIGICLLIGAMAKSSQVGLHVWLPMAMEGLNRAFLKLHYMREHPFWIFWSIVYFVSLGKIQIIGQSAGNQLNNLGSSETTREAITFYDINFERYFILEMVKSIWFG
jgi:NADH-ubiquinone oxidoreductase chain 5